MTFEELNLSDDLLRALEDQGYETPTPIQEQAIPALLDGRDILAIAQTGTGKTAAFSLPVLEHIANDDAYKGRRRIKALVVTPTRELAAQIGENFEAYAKYMDVGHTVIFGGVKQSRQVKRINRGVDILVATPGRLLDLENQGLIDLSHIAYLILDEADRMLDMGFVNDIKRIIKLLPKKRQNLLFSATMPPKIAEFATSLLHDPVRVSVTPEETTVEAITQKVMFVTKSNKKRLLPWLVEELDIHRSIVFSRTKHGANRIVKQLIKEGVNAAAIHGNKSQGARTRALKAFKEGEVNLLVATDIASRGIDIESVEYVINFDLPNIEESYVHRIGRTGRAGKRGIALSFCEGGEEGGFLRDIERLIGFNIEVDDSHPFHCEECIPEENATGKKKKKRNRSKNRGDQARAQRGENPNKKKSGNRNRNRGRGRGNNAKAKQNTKTKKD